MGQNEDRNSVVPRSTALSRSPSIDSSLVPGASPVKPVQPVIPVTGEMGYQPSKFEPPIFKVTSPNEELPLPTKEIPTPAPQSPAPTTVSSPSGFDAARWVANDLEGGEAYHEKNGDVTRYGIGDSGGYSKGMSANTPEEAAKIIIDKYASLPGIKEHFSQLTDPRDQVAVLQFALHRPGWLQTYFKQNAGKPFDRDAVLQYQEDEYHRHGGPLLQSFINRVNKARGYNPQMLAQAGEGS